MEGRLAALAAAAKITREQVKQLSEVSNIPLETISNYHQNDFMALCLLYSEFLGFPQDW